MAPMEREATVFFRPTTFPSKQHGQRVALKMTTCDFETKVGVSSRRMMFKVPDRHGRRLVHLEEISVGYLEYSGPRLWILFIVRRYPSSQDTLPHTRKWAHGGN